MRFFSDNAAPACQPVLDAILAANVMDTAYAGDAWSQKLDARFSELFETQVEVHWVATGTAANSLALAALCPPFGGIICHREAHIQADECGAPEFYTHGAKLMLLEGEGAKLAPETVTAHLDSIGKGVHWVQAHALSITNATEYGRAYTPDEVAALGQVCKAHGLGFHMDGARFANALVHLGCSPADVTWRAGIDVLSFGFTKNGGMGAEALVFFKPGLAGDSLYRRKRAGHLQSKGRYLAAQLLAMLDNDVWLNNARSANAGAKLLGEAAAERLLHPVETNEVFMQISAEEAAILRAQGFDFYDWGVGAARLVVSWNQQAADIAPLAKAIAAL